MVLSKVDVNVLFMHKMTPILIMTTELQAIVCLLYDAEVSNARSAVTSAGLVT